MLTENNDNCEEIIKINNNYESMQSLLLKLFKTTLDASLMKLESKSSSDFSNLKIVSKNFDDFSKKINLLKKNVDETLKKKEKEKPKKPKQRNEKKTISNNKKRTFSSNNIKISFNKKQNQTIMTEEEIENKPKNINTIGRGKTSRINKLGLRTASNFRTIQAKEKEKDKSRDKEIEIEGYNKQQKGYEGINLKKYKTSLNKSMIKKGINNNQGGNMFVNNLNKIRIKKNDTSFSHISSVKNSKIMIGINYSFDKVEVNTLHNNMINSSLFDIEEKTERKINNYNSNNNNNNNNNARRNNFKDKEDKEKEKEKEKKKILNDIHKAEIKNQKQNGINTKISNLNNNKRDVCEENNKNYDISGKIKKSNSINNEKTENKKEIANIVKLVDDVNQNIQNIDKIIEEGAQLGIQRRNSCIREGSKSFMLEKKNEIKEILKDISPDKSIIEQETETNLDDSTLIKNSGLNNQMSYNMFSNENSSKKNYKKIKIKIPKDIVNNEPSSKIRNNYNKREKEKDKEKEKEIKNYNYDSTKNKTKKSIKKIIMNSTKNKIKENEKKNENSTIINKEKKLTELILKNMNVNNKKENIETSFLNLIKKDNKIIDNILQYLSFEDKIYFLSVNKYLLKKKVTLLFNKKEALILILQLKKNETIEDKIKKLKNNITKEPSNLNHEFKLSKETLRYLKQLNEKQNINFFIENRMDKNKITEINIIYKILLLFLGEKKLVEISDDNIFWQKCCKYFLDNSDEGKIGNFIINQIKNFCFDHQTINLIEFTLIGNKNNIKNGYYEKLCKTTALLIPLIKQALIYCGIIISDKKNMTSRILDNLEYNQILIKKLDKIINYYNSK